MRDSLKRSSKAVPSFPSEGPRALLRSPELSLSQTLPLGRARVSPSRGPQLQGSVPPTEAPGGRPDRVVSG